MKIEKQNINTLMSKHIHQLSEEELNALAFLLDIKISNYKKNEHGVSFKMQHKESIVFVDCGKNSNASIGRSNKVKNGLSQMTSWGGTFSFTQIVKVFRSFFAKGYELTIQSPEKKEYNPEEWKENVFTANELVELSN